MKEIEKHSRSKKKTNDKLLVLAGFILLGLMPELAHAAPWDGPLQKLIDLLTGTTARLFAMLAIIIMGFMGMTGRINWGVAGSIVGGIILVFGAGYLADTFIAAAG